MGGKKAKIKKRLNRLKNPFFILAMVLLFIMLAINYLERIEWLHPLNGVLYLHFIPEVFAIYLLGAAHYTWKMSERRLWIVVAISSLVLFAISPTDTLTQITAVLLILPYILGFYIARFAYTHAKKKKKPLIWDDAGVLVNAWISQKTA